jgi:hypothetical protein
LGGVSLTDAEMAFLTGEMDGGELDEVLLQHADWVFEST